MPRTIAQVITDLALDRVFDYLIPPHLRRSVEIGSRVNVPFGNSRRQGYVVNLTNSSAFEQLKEIIGVEGDRALIPPRLMQLGEWMASYYCCPREQAIRALLPAVVRSGKLSQKTQKIVRLAEGIDVPAHLQAAEQRAPKQAEIIKLLMRSKQTTLAYANRLSASATKALRDAGTLITEDEAQERDPFANDIILPSGPLALTDEQATCMQAVEASFAAEKRQVILLFGVTGSGKTEVYLQAIGQCLERDEEAIVLVPEIALTPQTTERFRSRFGDLVSVLHSHLSDGERFDEWTKISEGRVRIVVGARSALFAPFRKLGLIVVDEEHETSYKQTDVPPRYHARDVAVMRGARENATVILGSATPSLESFWNTANGKYQLARLTKRVDDQQMPAMEVVDMVAEADATGRPQILSRRLISCVHECLEKSEQVMLFLNRRGYATNLQCLQCGYKAECDDCTVNYTYHRKVEQLICHFCGAVRHAPQQCPKCGDANIRYGGLGTQKVESAVRAVFPTARTLRMDSDTMTRKDSYREALTSFRAGTIDILVGTQMIAKGLHFPNVTLVGIIYADLSLNLPDFRSGERTFQLLVQVAGRAGRGQVPGRVIVQTYTPYHQAVQAALRQDYDEFYQGEIVSRQQAEFPPLSHMILLVFRGENESLVEKTANACSKHLEAHLPEETVVIPPMPSPIARKRGLYHYQMLLATKRIVHLSRRLKEALAGFSVPPDVRLTVDVDPFSVI